MASTYPLEVVEAGFLKQNPELRGEALDERLAKGGVLGAGGPPGFGAGAPPGGPPPGPPPGPPGPRWSTFGQKSSDLTSPITKPMATTTLAHAAVVTSRKTMYAV